jgi:hypothetical protein
VVVEPVVKDLGKEEVHFEIVLEHFHQQRRIAHHQRKE